MQRILPKVLPEVERAHHRDPNRLLDRTSVRVAWPAVIRDVLSQATIDALASLGVEVSAPVHLERPARREHGDWSTNVALATAKKAGRNPRELASQLAVALEAAKVPHVAKVEIAGPEGYARPDVGGGKRVDVEFLSANPTGPIHAGGGRWAAYGDALVNLLNRCGYRADREYYLNDRGTQMRLFGE
ncbi:MAG TPA: hypothetical protein VFK43_19775, partial [Acidimicrobiales bacterium]|nr:hypothetical protein [Acidimicrobiales bacterium]